jgi:hypothetical protein
MPRQSYTCLLGQTKKTTNAVALVRKRNIPTERPPRVDEISANFSGIEGVAWSAQRIPTTVKFDFLDLTSLLSHCYYLLKVENINFNFCPAVCNSVFPYAQIGPVLLSTLFSEAVNLCLSLRWDPRFDTHTSQQATVHNFEYFNLYVLDRKK